MRVLPKQVIQSAIEVTSQPELFLDDTALFVTAWATLKADRGQAFDPARLKTAHLIERPEPEPTNLEQRVARAAGKARAIAAAKGYNLPPAA